MDQSFDDAPPRIYTLKRDPNFGYGFVIGHEYPTMVKLVKPNGPSYRLLSQGDVIMSINGIDVETASRDNIIRMINLNLDQIEIKVRQPTYKELIESQNPEFYQSKSSVNSASENFRSKQHSLNPSPLNRLVTSISQQQHANGTSFSPVQSESSPVQMRPFNSNTVLRQIKNNNGATGTTVARAGVNQPNGNSNNNGATTDKPIDGNQIINGTRTLTRTTKNYGRHSPLPQRCKSSIDGTQLAKPSKKSGDNDNDQPLLKRSNTMRPMRPPPKVMEIYKNVIRVFFESGDTKLLNYGPTTTVGNVLESLNARITNDQVKSYFGLALTVGVNAENGQNDHLPKRKLLHILDENDSIIKIRQLPYANRLRLVYRIVDPPTDVCALYKQDKVAFNYLYNQTCNDLKFERFSPELTPETALKMTALHLIEYVHTNHSKAIGNSKDPKNYIKLVKKEPGLEFFLSASFIETFTDKKGKKIVGNYRKMKLKLVEHLKKTFDEIDFEPLRVKSTTSTNPFFSFHEISLPGIQSSTSDYIKLLFLTYLSEFPCYSNSKRSIRESTSPTDMNKVDCSSSLESVPRTSDSSPLINNRNHSSSQNLNAHQDHPIINTATVSRLAQMNSVKSLNLAQPFNHTQSLDQPDMAQTPSIESISSITFNMQNSPSPQRPTTYAPQQQAENYPTLTRSSIITEPSPMPRQQMISSRMQDYNSVDKLYSQRYTSTDKSIEELLRRVTLLPPPPPPSSMLMEGRYLSQTLDRRHNYAQNGRMTQVLTDMDIELLRVPPPPPPVMFDC